MSWQEAQPTLNAVERGRPLSPPYDFPLEVSEVKQDAWKHVCPCRFGEGRGSDGSKWSGDCYRYDIFVSTETWRARHALRWWNGAGEGWLIEDAALPDNRPSCNSSRPCPTRRDAGTCAMPCGRRRTRPRSPQSGPRTGGYPWLSSTRSSAAGSGHRTGKRRSGSRCCHEAQ